MFALSLGAARSLAVMLTIFFGVLALVALYTMGKFSKKITSALLLGCIALGLWTQRNNLEDCGKNLKARVENGSAVVGSCRFLGITVRL